MDRRDKWTDVEYAILAETAERKGWDWVEEHASHCLAQAELVYGNLDELEVEDLE